MGLSTKKELIFDTTAFGGLAFYILISAIFLKFVPLLGFQLVLGLVLAFLVVFSIRLIHFRQRPDASKVRHWYDRVTQSSFPSLHATRVTVLSVLVSMFLQDVFITVLAALVIAITCWTRILLRRHYASDLVAGVVMGTIIAYIAQYGVSLLLTGVLKLAN